MLFIIFYFLVIFEWIVYYLLEWIKFSIRKQNIEDTGKWREKYWENQGKVGNCQSGKGATMVNLKLQKGTRKKITDNSLQSLTIAALEWCNVHWITKTLANHIWFDMGKTGSMKAYHHLNEGYHPSVQKTGSWGKNLPPPPKKKIEIFCGSPWKRFYLRPP